MMRKGLVGLWAICVFSAHAQVVQLPPIEPITQYQPKLPLQVFTSDGVEIAQFGAERREYTPLAKTPKLMQQAILAIEDSRFREHSGIDFQGMARAALAPLLGRRMHGASTITQQLVRTMLLSRELTVERKTKEIMLALKVEQAISKDRILEIYMNEIFLGQRAYGFASAAKTYFGKKLDELSIAEAAMLAGLPQNPHYANPVANLARATRRQHTVLDRMLATGVINDKQHAAAKAEALKIRPPGQRSIEAQHVAEMARLAVVERLGTAAAYTQGIRVVTSLKAADQRAASDAVQRNVLAYDRRQPWRGPEALESLPSGDAEIERVAASALKHHKDDDVLRLAIVLQATSKAVQVVLANGERATVSGEGLKWATGGLSAKAAKDLRIERGSVLRLQQITEKRSTSWHIVQWPQVQSALVSLDSKTGRIRALVGGFDFAQNAFNHATQAFRQPGSAFKPFLVSAAMEERVMPGSLIDDLAFVGADGWSPSNSYNSFLGPMSMRQGLAKSSNMVMIRLLQHTSTARAKDWSARLGLDAAKQPDNLTLALGTGAVTPLQMARAYAVFANGGWLVSPTLIERISDAQGKVLFEAAAPEAQTDANRAIPERNAWLVDDLLGEVVRTGTAARAGAALKRSDLHGKTGTTDGAADAWFVGYQPSVVAAVWMGHPKPTSMGDRESGSRLALPIWIDYMAAALKGVPVATPTEPPAGLVRGADDWLYSEWLGGNWVNRIAAEGGVGYAPPPAPASAPASPPASAP